MAFNFLDKVTKEQYKKLLLANQELAMENHELKLQIQQLTADNKNLRQTLIEREDNFNNYILKLTTTLEAAHVTIKELQAKIVELERKVNMDSSNSSMSPSSDKKFNKKIKKDDDGSNDDDSDGGTGVPIKKMNLLEKLQEFAKDTNKSIKFTSRDVAVLDTLLLTKEFQVNGVFGSKRSTLSKLADGNFAECNCEEIDSLLKIKEFITAADYKRRGGQFGHKGHYLEQVSNPDKIKWLEPKVCECGCSELTMDRGNYEARQVVDVIIKRLVTEYRLVSGDCTGCGEKVKIISDIPNNISYSHTVRCFAVYMLDAHFMTYERLAEYFRDIFNLPISEGSINNWRKEFAAKIGEKYLDKIKEVLLAANYLNADETTINIAGDKVWCHTVCNESATLLAASISRGITGITASGVLDKYDGQLVVDGWSSYASLPSIKGIQTCFAHLFRYFTDMHENYKQQWALTLLIFLTQFIDMTKELHGAGIRRYSITQRAKYYKEYDHILTVATKELSSFDFEDDHKTRQLLRRLQRDKALVLRFLDDTSLPLTNNMAERSLRPLKVQQKISGCSLSMSNAQENLNIRSFIATVKKQGQNVLDAMLKIFKNPADFEIKVAR